MNIKITDKALRQFLNTSASPSEIANKISLCGPTFNQTKKIGKEYLYEIEIITNRIDTVSAQGIARDSATILNQMGIRSSIGNDPYKEKINLYEKLPKTFFFEISDNKLSPRFTAVSLENVTIKDSSKETQNFLTLCDERPINNAVDITNELTILCGMPIHIFDLDKLAPQKLIIRESKKDEKIQTLDNQNNKLPGGDIVIEDGVGRLVDLCGIMGGSVAEVDKYTKNILLIVPTYSPSRVRKTSLFLQKRTLAAQIYEKQPDTELCLPVLMKAIQLFKDRTGAVVSSKVYDSNPSSYKPSNILLDCSWVNKFIGIDIPQKTVISILDSLGIASKQHPKDILICQVPSWRQHDLKIKEDLVEEIARVYGYSKLPSIIPCVNLHPEKYDSLLSVEAKIRNFLSCLGFNEIYNSSLISGEQIENLLLQKSSHLKLQNALSQEYEYLRTSLVPSLLQNLKNNQGKSDGPFNLYELSNVYLKSKEKLPQETSNLVMVSTNDFFHTKGYLELLLSHLIIKQTSFIPTKKAPPYFDLNSTAEIYSNKLLLGFIGSIKPNIIHSLEITSNPIVIELNLPSLSYLSKDHQVYTPISEFPEVIEEITLNSKQNIGEIMNTIYSSNKTIKKVEYLSSYQDKHSFKISFSSTKGNLSHKELNQIKKEILLLFN